MSGRTLTWVWMLRRQFGLSAICPACLHPPHKGQKCNWTDDPPPSKQWRYR